MAKKRKINRTLLIVLLAIAAMLVGGAGLAYKLLPRDPGARYAKALEMEQEGKWDEAAHALAQAVSYAGKQDPAVEADYRWKYVEFCDRWIEAEGGNLTQEKAQSIFGRQMQDMGAIVRADVGEPTGQAVHRDPGSVEAEALAYVNTVPGSVASPRSEEAEEVVVLEYREPTWNAQRRLTQLAIDRGIGFGLAARRQGLVPPPNRWEELLQAAKKHIEMLTAAELDDAKRTELAELLVTLAVARSELASERPQERDQQLQAAARGYELATRLLPSRTDWWRDWYQVLQANERRDAALVVLAQGLSHEANAKSAVLLAIRAYDLLLESREMAGQASVLQRQNRTAEAQELLAAAQQKRAEADAAIALAASSEDMTVADCLALAQYEMTAIPAPVGGQEPIKSFDDAARARALRYLELACEKSLAEDPSAMLVSLHVERAKLVLQSNARNEAGEPAAYDVLRAALTTLDEQLGSRNLADLPRTERLRQESARAALHGQLASWMLLEAAVSSDMPNEDRARRVADARGHAAEIAKLPDDIRTLYDDSPPGRQLAGLLALADNEREKAVALLGEASDRGGLDPIATQLLLMLYQRSEPGEAIRLLSQRLMRNPDNFPLLEMLANLQINARQLDAAAVSLDRLVRLAQTPDERLTVAELQIKARRYDDATALVNSLPAPELSEQQARRLATLHGLLQAVSASPGTLPEAIAESDVPGWLLRAQQLANTGQADVAVRICERIAEQYPTNEEAWVALVQVYDFASRTEDARRAAALARRQVPGSATLRELETWVNLSPAQREAALSQRIAAQRQQIEQIPDEATREAGLAELERRLGNTDTAIAHLERSVAANPSLTPAVQMLLMYYADQRRFDDAQQLVERARANLPEADRARGLDGAGGGDWLARIRFSRGRQLMAEGKEDQAAVEWRAVIELLQQVVTVRAVHSEAYAMLGEAYRLTGDVERAKQNLLKAREQDPSNLMALRGLALVSRRQNQLADQKRYLRDLAIAGPQEPGNEPFIRELVDLYFSTSDWNGLEEFVGTRRRLVPGDRYAYDVEYRMWRARENWAEAARTAQEALRLDPQNGELVMRYAEGLNGAGRYQDAMVLLTNPSWATQMQPGAPLAAPLLAYKARAQMGLNLRPQAEQTFRDAFAAASGSQPRVVLNELVNALNKDKTAARTMMESWSDTGWAVAFALGQLRQDAGDWAGARDVYLEALEAENSPKPFIHGQLGVVYSYLGSYEEARQEYLTALSLNEQQQVADDAALLNNLAYVLANNLNDAVAALPYAERAADAFRRQAGQDNATILDTLGWALYKAGDPQRAERELARSVETDPTSAACYHLGQVLEAAGRPDEALERYQQGFELVRGAPTDEFYQPIQERLNALQQNR